jgi:cytidylate kinase
MNKRSRPVIAIDGPVGAGKSTVARELARALGFTYLNTGAMYRAVAVAARYNNIKPDDSDADQRLGQLLETIDISFKGERVFLAGRDISAEISSPEIGDLASRFSTSLVVRTRMRELQRVAGAEGGVVMEGRDIGTAVFPDAEFKFYLTADVEVRAARRYAELAAKGVDITQAEVLAQLKQRDERDRARELAPLRRADDAIAIDSSGLDAGQVARAMLARIAGGTQTTKDLKRG